MKIIIFGKNNSAISRKANAANKPHKKTAIPLIKKAGAENVNLAKISKSVYDSNRVTAYQPLVP